MPPDLLSFLNDAFYDGLPYALVCLSFVLTAKYIRFPDLTCSGSFVLGGAVAATAIVRYGVDPIVATMLAAVSGVLAGLLTGFFHAVLQLERLLAGILSAFVLYSVNLLLLNPTLAYGAHATPLSWLEAWDRQLVYANVSWHPGVILFLAGMVCLIKGSLDWFLGSETGLAVRALEDDIAGEYVLQRQGLSPDRYKVTALAMGNGIVGLAGALVSYKEGAANADRGFDLLITALVAFLLGAQLFRLFQGVADRWSGKRLRLQERTTAAAVSGALVYFCLITLSQRTNMPSGYTKILLVTFVALSLAPSASITSWFRSRQARDETMGSGTALLDVAHLTYRYPSADADALHDLSFEVPPGGVVHLRGGNGTGKTTALRVLAGFLPASPPGRILYQGADVTRQADRRRTGIAYIDQDAKRGVVGTLSALENLALASICGTPSFWRRAIRPETMHRVAAIITDAGLPPDVALRRADTLSGGQRQVVNVLSVLARPTPPGLLLLDEPTNNLDVNNTKRCQEIINHLNRSGTAIILVSHAPLDGLPITSTVEVSAPTTVTKGVRR